MYPLKGRITLLIRSMFSKETVYFYLFFWLGCIGECPERLQDKFKFPIVGRWDGASTTKTTRGSNGKCSKGAILVDGKGVMDFFCLFYGCPLCRSLWTRKVNYVSWCWSSAHGEFREQTAIIDVYPFKRTIMWYNPIIVGRKRDKKKKKTKILSETAIDYIVIFLTLIVLLLLGLLLILLRPRIQILDAAFLIRHNILLLVFSRFFFFALCCIIITS